MSPEQVQGQPVDGRSDQFSLAVIGYEMLTGEKPYTGEHLTTVVYKIVAEEPVPPRRLNPSLSTGIENVLRKALTKKPDARYRNCQDFVESLEKACSASKGWKPMPRGGVLNAPTMADVKAPPVVAPAPAALPPPRRKGRPEPTPTATAEAKRKSGFPAFLLVVLLAAGLLALIGWQAAPWLMPGREPSDSGEHRAAAPKRESPVPATPPVTAPLVVPGVAPGDAKPSPVGPTTAEAGAPKVGQAVSPASSEQEAVKSAPADPSTAAPKTERRPPTPVRAGVPREVSIMSSPGGATATLDGNQSPACSTPCSLSAAPGRHTLALTLRGYQIERREFTVGASPLELTPVALKAAGGTLMLTSDPTGAAISVNGKRIDRVTPAQIPLGLGVYSIMIEKGGRQATEQVEIKDRMVTRKIILGR
jgi:serine/threonine-protein kinase